MNTNMCILYASSAQNTDCFQKTDWKRDVVALISLPRNAPTEPT